MHPERAQNHTKMQVWCSLRLPLRKKSHKSGHWKVKKRERIFWQSDSQIGTCDRCLALTIPGLKKQQPQRWCVRIDGSLPLRNEQEGSETYSKYPGLCGQKLKWVFCMAFFKPEQMVFANCSLHLYGSLQKKVPEEIQICPHYSTMQCHQWKELYNFHSSCISLRVSQERPTKERCLFGGRKVPPKIVKPSIEDKILEGIGSTLGRKL